MTSSLIRKVVKEPDIQLGNKTIHCPRCKAEDCVQKKIKLFPTSRSANRRERKTLLEWSRDIVEMLSAVRRM
jgi:hypothetical protein